MKNCQYPVAGLHNCVHAFILISDKTLANIQNSTMYAIKTCLNESGRIIFKIMYRILKMQKMAKLWNDWTVCLCIYYWMYPALRHVLSGIESRLAATLNEMISSRQCCISSGMVHSVIVFLCSLIFGMLLLQFLGLSSQTSSHLFATTLTTLSTTKQHLSNHLG